MSKQQKDFLSKHYFANTEALLMSRDTNSHPDKVTKTDVLANDRVFLTKFKDLLRGTKNL